MASPRPPFVNAAKTEKRLRRIDASVFRAVKEPRRLLRGELAGFLRGEFTIHDATATHAQIGAMLDHAGRDL
jgi:hypothetical protein